MFFSILFDLTLPGFYVNYVTLVDLSSTLILKWNSMSNPTKFKWTLKILAKYFVISGSSPLSEYTAYELD